ncbi:hypothetical protein NDU88_004795 [Pleurodeles waltl]|uniref:Uncharacterized protein n=1 Tax=Pleurodeles waltl TaxID=8319 RepID=A0AAV7VI43_PLEWA|nr:hypothetical protein NDU88_004795 [Pleurodeles waltl]
MRDLDVAVLIGIVVVHYRLCDSVCPQGVLSSGGVLVCSRAGSRERGSQWWNWFREYGKGRNRDGLLGEKSVVLEVLYNSADWRIRTLYSLLLDLMPDDLGKHIEKWGRTCALSLTVVPTRQLSHREMKISTVQRVTQRGRVGEQGLGLGPAG